MQISYVRNEYYALYTVQALTWGHCPMSGWKLPQLAPRITLWHIAQLDIVANRPKASWLHDICKSTEMRPPERQLSTNAYTST